MSTAAGAADLFVEIVAGIAERDIVGAALAQLHGIVPRQADLDADDRLGPEHAARLVVGERIVLEMHAVGAQQLGVDRIVGDQRGHALGLRQLDQRPGHGRVELPVVVRRQQQARDMTACQRRRQFGGALRRLAGMTR